MSKVRLIALDLDGTTLDSSKQVSEKNRNAIINAVKNGVHVCIASGRAFDTLPSVVTEIPGIEYAITSNGAAVYEIRDKKCLRSYKLTAESVKTILELTKDMPVTYEAFIEGRAYAGSEYIHNPVKFGATKEAIHYIQTTRTLIDDITGFIRQHVNELDSMDIIVKDADMKEKVCDAIYKETQDVYITSSVKQLVEISYKDAGKKSGVKFLADRLGVSKEEIAAFGDAEKDKDMIEYAGYGIAVANASISLKEKADYITLSNDEDGIAYAFANILDIKS
ncbi:MAG: Cof-type HAD-IIB family hydrolase [Lachnospira sp.]|nr:Cof-type HAD-IIB family hydrolase [Lachnospira sp.]